MKLFIISADLTHNENSLWIKISHMKKPLLSALIVTILSCSTTAPAPKLLQASEITRDDGSRIQFYLEHKSVKNRADTLLLYLQGSDCNSVVHDKFLHNSAQAVWPSADVLTVEKRGITAKLPYSAEGERQDCPAEYIQRDNPQQRVADIQVILNSVLSQHRYKNVVALGGSEGAQIAGMIASVSDAVNVAVLINSGGRHFLDDVLHNIALTSPPDAREAALHGFNEFVTQILTAEPFAVEASNHGYSWWRSMLTYDQQNILRSINGPMLIIQSGLDQSVSPEAVAAMIENLRSLGKTNLDFVVYPDLDHGLINSAGISMADKVARDINQWLGNQL